MTWTNRGLVFLPSGELWWARSRALFPTVEAVSERVLRAYFTSMDDKNVGRVGFVDLDADDPARLLSEPCGPVLDVGPAGAFDHSGANACSIVRFDGRSLLYYQGWRMRQGRAPYEIFSGSAEAPAGSAEFLKTEQNPVLGPIESDPFIRGTPWVLNAGPLFKMWYASCSEWVERSGRSDYRVAIAYLESDDPFSWTSSPRLVLSSRKKDDYATGRPTVIQIEGVYHMWYSIRSFSRPYRLAYARSTDGVDWICESDELVPPPSGQSWDSEAMCYPCALLHRGLVYLFYCGNGQGRSGFGCATIPARAL